MIRRSFIVLCVTAALATLFGGAVSHYGGFMFSVALNPRHWLVLHFYDAQIHFFSIESMSDSIYVEREGKEPHLWVSHGRPFDDFFSVGPLEDRFWTELIFVGSRGEIRRYELPCYGSFPFASQRAGRPRASYQFVRLPYWLVALVFLAPPVRRLWVILRKRSRRQRGLCQNCAYDLRGLPEPRCPECGQSIPQSAPRADDQ